VQIDGRKAGDIRFPGGEIDLTGFCQPGSKHLLTLLVMAMPLKAVMLSYSDTAGAKEIRGRVERRGLCGDVYLVAPPAGAGLGDVQVRTSMRNWEFTLDAEVQGLAANTPYSLRARITDRGIQVAEFTGRTFGTTNLKAGRIEFTKPW